MKDNIEMTVSDQFSDLTLELYYFYQEIDFTNSQVVVPCGVLRELSRRWIVKLMKYISIDLHLSLYFFQPLLRYTKNTYMHTVNG